MGVERVLHIFQVASLFEMVTSESQILSAQSNKPPVKAALLQRSMTDTSNLDDSMKCHWTTKLPRLPVAFGGLLAAFDVMTA